MARGPLDITFPNDGDPGTDTPASVNHGSKNVTTAGTDVPLVASSTPCKSVTVMARSTNTSAIVVGGSGVDATLGTGNGVLLYALDAITIEVDDLADVYIDSLVNGEGVKFTYTV